MLEILALLLPVAAASGWYAAKKHYARDDLDRHVSKFRESYHLGLSFLLQARTDKAIDAIAPILAAKLDNFEIHLALGTFFRRNGEVDKAIDIHKTLVSQAHLDETQRDQAAYELGLDYVGAGLFDRAEAVFDRLAKRTTHSASSLKHLLQIYQQEREWEKAIDVTRQLLRMGKIPPRRESVAQFLCELAEVSLQRGLREDADRLLHSALEEDWRCVRASLALAKGQMQDRHWDQAVATLRRIDAQDPDYLAEGLEPLRECYQALSRRDVFRSYLEDIHKRYFLEDAADYLADELKETKGAGAALSFLAERVQVKPSFRLASKLLRLLADVCQGEQQWILDALARVMLDARSSDLKRYACFQCGFRGDELHWRCPSCHHWETVRLQSEQGHGSAE